MTPIQAVMKVCQRIWRHLQATGYNGTAIFMTYSPGHNRVAGLGNRMCSWATRPLTPAQGAMDADTSVDEVLFKVMCKAPWFTRYSPLHGTVLHKLQSS